MRFASLGSGSRGNATLVTAGKTTVMIDCGFSAREAEKRLRKLGVDPYQLSALLVTHEHADHMAGIRVMARKFRLPVYTTPGTAGCLPVDIAAHIKTFNCHETFSINDLEVEPFPVPHDAREPSQFVFGNGQHRLGLLTDVGSITPLIEETLSGCNALLLEANHDMMMLEQGEYPEHLKRRVGGRLGHLNNVQSASLLEKIDTTNLQHIMAMHISEKNNCPSLVVPLLADALACEHDWIGIADQEAGFDWREITNR
ncbi:MULTISPECIES: MBL fold metallo-hydrolase [Methylophaga]|jgi:phosphoribosyl 1,2-cyclic phosphodiesterase|uniref:MBL fold metallo-hydrolase n=1 Tax=Methylophaga marina TaxID=45495 RepID=A0ABN0TJY5_9GAMM|nr:MULTISPECIES: MBL fold metallo-hydrolase [Methylophaga]BDZ72304.1 MBL fold metallo-hydrolase [Methylophaga marina]BDZ75410.1 MBL fold metallo-hydrolase [Methylophaga marina]|tara:strand:+ start:288 stop:1055 length:768 start_codon:yes stop_codon:yes gene_type:complete